MEELKHRLEALAKKIALKEAEILDLRNEVQTLRTLMNNVIDEQIRIEEAAAEKAATEHAAEAARQALEEQKQKEEEAEKARLAAEKEANLLEEEARIAQAKAMEKLRKSQEEAEKAAIKEKEAEAQKAKEEAEKARQEAEKLAAEKEEQERIEAELKAQEEATEKRETKQEAASNKHTRVPEQDHEAIMRTIENMANGVSSSQSRAERFQDKPTLGDKVSRSRLHDIKKAIGLNEKFLYANELFNGDMSAFSKAVEELNHVDSEHDANRILEEELADKYHWNEEDETVMAFKSLVSRRFV